MTLLYRPPPSEQVYESYLPGRYAGFRVERYFAERFPYLSETQWRDLLLQDRVTVNGRPARPGLVLHLHDRIVTRMGVRQEPAADCTLRLLYEDRHLRVFNKGAPLPVHPCGRYHRNSLTELLRRAYPEEVPRPVQRLDALTTGLQVFARTRRAARDLMFAFQENRVVKDYLALVRGVPRERVFVVDRPIGKIAGSARGTGPRAQNPKPARTAVYWLAHREGVSLLRVRPLTGRTNQIRVHLAACGLPLVQDPVYGDDAEGGRPCGLHAFRLTLVCLGRSLRLTAPPPALFDTFREWYENPRLPQP